MRIKDANAALSVFGSTHGPAVHAELASLVASTGALLRGHFRLQSGLHTPHFLRFGQLAYDRQAAARIAELAAELIVGPLAERPAVLCAETAARFLGTALADVIKEQSEVTVGRHLRAQASPPSPAGVGMPSRSGATNVIKEQSEVTVGRHLPSRSGATQVIRSAPGGGAELAIAEADERRQPRAALRAGSLEGRREVLVVTDVVTSGRSIAPLVDMARATPGVERVRLVAFACLDPRGIRGALAHLRVDGGSLLEGRWTSYAASDCALCREGVELVPAYEFN